MYHLCSSATLKHTLVFIVLMTSASANASLLDCTESSGATLAAGVECASVESLLPGDQTNADKEATPAPPIGAAFAGYQIGKARSPSALPESAPLLVLVVALLAVVLVRAKSHNSK